MYYFGKSEENMDLSCIYLVATYSFFLLKFIFSRNAVIIDKIFTVDLTLYSKCQIDAADFVNFCGLLRKHEL